MKHIFLFSLIVVGALAIESNFYREESCSAEKGYCVLESECPHSVSATHKNLCAGQKNEGAVCCTNFPEDQLNCNQLHHACMDRCAKFLDLGPKGCTGGKTCCILV